MRLRNPSLHQKLNGDNSSGLSNYLTGACSPPEVMQKPNGKSCFHRLWPASPNAADLLGGPRVLSLLSIGCEVFDPIVIDGPPVLGLADAPLTGKCRLRPVFIVAAGTARPRSFAVRLNGYSLPREIVHHY